LAGFWHNGNPWIFRAAAGSQFEIEGAGIRTVGNVRTIGLIHRKEEVLVVFASKKSPMRCKGKTSH